MMNKFKILCFVFGSFYLLQGTPEVKAGFADTFGAIGNAVDAANKHAQEDAAAKKSGGQPADSASEE